MPFEKSALDQKAVDHLIDYLHRVNDEPPQTFSAMRGVLDHAMRLARKANATSPMFRSIRQVPFERREDGTIERALVTADFAEVEKCVMVAPDRVPPVGPGPNDYVIVPEVELVKHVRVTDVAKAGRVLRRWNKLKGCFEFLPRR